MPLVRSLTIRLISLQVVSDYMLGLLVRLCEPTTSEDIIMGKKQVKKGDTAVQEAPKFLTMRDVLIEAVQVETSIEDLRTEVKNLSGGVSQHLLKVAQGFTTAKAFLSACEIDEAWIKSDDAYANKVDKLPRCWTQAKSNIKAAFKHGLDLSSYEKEFDMRKDLNDKRKGTENQTDQQKAQKALGDVIEKVIDPRIGGVIEALMGTLMGLEGDEAIEFALEGMKTLMVDIKAFKVLVPEKPVKEQEGVKATQA